MSGPRPQSSNQQRPSTVTNVQMEQVKGVIKQHLEKHKFFDGLKSAVAKDPKLNKLDRNQIIEKLKSEGVLNEILQQIPTKRKPMSNAAGGAVHVSNSLSNSDSLHNRGLPTVAPSQRRMMNANDLDPNKRYMSCSVVRGNAFVDFVNIRPDEQLSVTVSFLKSRFSTQIVQASSDPIFDETFMFEFVGDNEEVKFDPSMLLKLNQPIHVTILKHRVNEKPVVLGTKNIDWRPALHCNQIEVNAEILPISLTHRGSLGVLTMHIDLVPSLSRQELLTEEAVEKQTGLEKKFESETVQRFLDYAHDWWNDFKQIRPTHKNRLVKIFAETDDRESSVYKPVCSLIGPMMADRLLESPLHAARFVSLIPFHRMESPGAEKLEVWHSMQSFLSRGCGDSEDHAVLLCNLLLGFGLDAYVVVGTNSEGSHAWVMTRQPPNAQGKQHVDFWESLTGTKLANDDPRVHRFYRTVGSVFSNKTFFANIQSDDRVVNTVWDLEDQYLWKAMSPQYINTLTPSASIGYLMPSNSQSSVDDEKLLESILKQKLGGLRRNEHNLSTQWDAQLSYLLSTALANYEFERIGGGNFATVEFQHGIKNYVPEGHIFKAFPIQFTHCDSDRIITHIYSNQIGKEIVMARGDQCRHALRVKIVQYPENVSAVWVMIAVRTRSAQQ